MKKKGIYHTAFLILIIEIIVKFLGFAKQSVIAYYFGANSEMDVYFVASDFINGFSNAIISSSRVAVISIYTAIKVKEGKEKSDNLISFLLELLVPLSVLCSFILYLFSGFIARLLGPNFSGDNIDILSLYIKVLSGILVLSISCMIFDAVLSSHEKYYISRTRSFIYSIGIILGSVFFAEKYGIKVLLFMQYCTLVIYMIIQFIASNRIFSFHLIKKGNIEDIKKILILVIPTFIGNSMVQLNYWVDNAVATNLEDGSVSALSYSHVLDDFFIGILIVSVTSVLFPHFANLVEKDDKEQVRDTLVKGMSTMFALLIPISIITFFGSKDMVTIAFFRGKFTYNTLVLTTLALQGYVLRYPFVAVRDISIQGLYAYKNMKNPMIIAMMSTIINVLLSVVLSKYIGLIAITIATSISAVFGAIMNFHYLRKYIKDIKYVDIFSVLYRGIPMGIISVIIVVFENQLLGIHNSFLHFIIVGITVCIVFFLGMLLLKDKTIISLTKGVLNKLHIAKKIGE